MVVHAPAVHAGSAQYGADPRHRGHRDPSPLPRRRGSSTLAVFRLLRQYWRGRRADSVSGFFPHQLFVRGGDRRVAGVGTASRAFHRCTVRVEVVAFSQQPLPMPRFYSVSATSAAFTPPLQCARQLLQIGVPVIQNRCVSVTTTPGGTAVAVARRIGTASTGGRSVNGRSVAILCRIVAGAHGMNCSSAGPQDLDQPTSCRQASSPAITSDGATDARPVVLRRCRRTDIGRCRTASAADRVQRLDVTARDSLRASAGSHRRPTADREADLRAVAGRAGRARTATSTVTSARFASGFLAEARRIDVDRRCARPAREQYTDGGWSQRFRTRLRCLRDREALVVREIVVTGLRPASHGIEFRSCAATRRTARVRGIPVVPIRMYVESGFPYGAGRVVSAAV